MLRRAGLYLEGFQLLLGFQPAEGTLDDDGCMPQLPETPTCHPTPGMLLDDGGLVLYEDLAGDKHIHPVGLSCIARQEQESLCNHLERRDKLGLSCRRQKMCPLTCKTLMALCFMNKF